MMSCKIPNISEGFHVNMALFMWRKSMSTTCYLGDREVLTCIVLPSTEIGLSGTSLTSSMGSKDHADHLGLGVALASACKSAVRALDLMMALAYLQHSMSQL